MEHSTKEQLIQQLKDFYSTNGRTPFKRELPNRSTFERHFGSWNKALTAADLPLTKSSPNEITKTICSCSYCGKSFEKQTSQIYKSVNHFCSRSCAATYNNKTKPKRQAKTEKNYCNCGAQIPYRNKTCVDCRYSLADQPMNTIFRTGPDKYRRVRDHARNLYYKKGTCCELCGYKKHVEICHIKALSDFPDDTLVSVVNHKNNIKILCRNCHWELDNPDSQSDQ